jgi:hypothetical protein
MIRRQGAQCVCLVAHTGKDSLFSKKRLVALLLQVSGMRSRSLRNEAYFAYAAVTKDAAQRRIRTFYGAVRSNTRSYYNRLHSPRPHPDV